MKNFIKERIWLPLWESKVLISMLGFLIILIPPVKLYLIGIKISSYNLVIVLLISLFAISVLLYRNKHLQIEIEDLKLADQDVAVANGLQIYRDFAYFDPEIGPAELYCKYCVEEHRKIRRLTDNNPNYYCTSCKQKTVDRHEYSKILGRVR